MKDVKIFGSIVEEEARQQIEKLANYEPYKDAKIRIMPDVHAGKGCTIGTTMTIKDAITPNLVGVDIGCGMYVIPLGKVDIDLEKFDKVVNEKIPSGFNIHETPQRIFMDLNMLHCREVVDFDIAQRSIGSLGGGNHFIELNEDEEGNKYLVIHSGSRNLGVRVCNYYQKIAEKNCRNSNVDRNKIIAELKAQGRESEIQDAIKALKPNLADKDLAHLTGEDMQNYLHDMDICQRYAELNRETIADLILTEFDCATCYATETPFHTIHNYIELLRTKLPTLLRKGAVAAYRGQRLIIPMNMRDGSLLCVGKGNTDWNWSAPHGAGRLMSRKKAKEAISMAEFEKSMSEVYSTSVCDNTLDEAPQVYKPMQAIIDAIHDTVDIVKIIKPIYNFKAKELTMTRKFTTPCFIRKSTVALRKKLEELGYKILNSGDTTLDAHNFDGKGHHKHINEGTAIITSYGGYYGVVYVADDVTNKGRIDCGTNEDLFLALVALREDSDYMQWFTDGTDFILCDRYDWIDMYSVLYSGVSNAKDRMKEFDKFHKATVEEIKRTL